MKVLWLFAHPEPRSLSGALLRSGLRALDRQGDEHRVSDLYAMGWKAEVDGADFRHDARRRLVVGAGSREAYESGSLSEGIRVEQDKLRWADAVIVQFPLWWYAMPAILKGWFDRVFVRGFAFGVTDSEGRSRRYGDGLLAGKRAMVVVTAGAREASLGPRGINGELNALLFPLQHGTLWYSGISVVPPLLIPGADRMSASAYRESESRLRERLRELASAEPLRFRSQNGGDYDENLVLRSNLAGDRSGLRVHHAQEFAR